MARAHVAILSLLTILALPLVCTLTPADAATPARTRAFVYGVTYYDGLSYGSTMVTPSSNTIYLMAGHLNVLILRQTMIYFWPLTNDYQADWSALNKPVGGMLEILRQGSRVSQVTLDDYVVQYDSIDPADTVQLYRGAAARQQVTRVKDLQQAYSRHLMDYDRAELKWRNKMDDLLRKGLHGGKVKGHVPPEPVAPMPVLLVTTNLDQGYAFVLNEGTYAIQVRRADGSIAPDSRKKLVVFSAQSQTAIGYDVVPEQRWTVPDQSLDPASVIYTTAGTTLYLQPYHETRVGTAQNARMREPQDVLAQPGVSTWIEQNPVPKGSLRIMRGRQIVADVPLQAWYVLQSPGPAFGYEVVPFDPRTMDTATFKGFRVDPSLLQNGASIVLLDQHGQAIPGSARPIRVLRTDVMSILYGIAGLPLLGGIGAWLIRRRKPHRSTLMT